MNQRASLAQDFVGRERIREELDRERIDIDVGNVSIAAATMGTSCILSLRSGVGCLYV